MVLASLPRRFESTLSALRVAVRRLLRADTNPVPADWTHVTKVDPETEKRLPLLYPLYLAHSSGISVGGSRSVTARNTAETFDLLAWADTPAFHEPSGASHVTTETVTAAEFLAIPEVLNGDTEALVGTLGDGIESIRESLAPGLVDDTLPRWVPAGLRDRLADAGTSWLLDRAVFEAYIIQNPDSAAAREAGVGPEDVCTPQDARRRAVAAERHLDSELIYLEYSGTFGGEEATAALEAIDDAVSWSRIWYGGGLADAEDVCAVREAGADTVVVGDAFHRVADEERELCERAAADLDDPHPEVLRDWLDDRVDASESAAAAFLSTIPEVSDPASRARRYLLATLRAYLDLAGEVAGTGGPSERGRAVGGEELAAVAGATADAYLDTVTERFEHGDPGHFAHLSVADAFAGRPARSPPADE